jgi:hypothetical protein
VWGGARAKRRPFIEGGRARHAYDQHRASAKRGEAPDGGAIRVRCATAAGSQNAELATGTGRREGVMAEEAVRACGD